MTVRFTEIQNLGSTGWNLPYVTLLAPRIVNAPTFLKLVYPYVRVLDNCLWPFPPCLWAVGCVGKGNTINEPKGNNKR
jgi:hypothetical protein